MVKPAPSSRHKAVLKSAPSTPKLPPPVEQHIVPVAVYICRLSHASMALPSLPSSIASSPATTLAPETPRVKSLPGPIPVATSLASSSSSSSAAAMGPPPAPKNKTKAKPTKEQVQTEMFRLRSTIS